MENKKYKIVIGVLVVLLIGALCAIVVLLGNQKDKDKKETDKPETKEVINKKEKDDSSEETKKEEKNKYDIKEEEKEDVIEKTFTNNKKYKIKEVLYDNTSYGNDDVEKVELTNDGVVLVSINGTGYDDSEDKEVSFKINRVEVASNVSKTFSIHVGTSDICEGNRRIMFIHKDGTVSYINIDDLACGQMINVIKFEGLKDVLKFEEKIVKHEGEPNEYIVYAVTKDGNKTDITEKIA